MGLFSFGGGSSSQETWTDQTSYSGQRSSQRQSGEQTRAIEGASEIEQELLSNLMQSLYANLQGAEGLITGGYQEAINTGMAEFNRLMESGAKTALSEMSKSGMSSSIVNNMMGAVSGGAAGQLAGNLMQLQANMPLQALNAVNSAASPMLSMLSNYFLAERGQNVTQTQSGQTTSSGSQETQQRGYQQGEGSSSNFGFEFGWK